MSSNKSVYNNTGTREEIISAIKNYIITRTNYNRQKSESKTVDKFEKESLYGSLLSKLEKREKENRLLLANKAPDIFSEKAIDFGSGDTLSMGTDYALRCKRLEELNKIKNESNVFSHGMTRAMISSKSAYPNNLAFIVENEIANNHGTKRALIFKSGFNANLSFIGCIADSNDFIVYDEQSHRSMMTGMQLSRAKKCIPFKHNDIEDLVSILTKIRNHSNQSGNIIICVESIYSMRGDIAPLKEIISECCEKYNAFLYVDEAHSFGMYGKNGLGLMSQYNLCQHPKVCGILVTYSKALACTGAAILCNSNVLCDYLNQYSIATIFSHFLSNSGLLAIKYGYEFLTTTQYGKRREYLFELKEYLIESCNKVLPANMCKYLSSSHIQPIVIGDDKICQQIIKHLWDINMFIVGVHYPVVPKHFSMIRVWLHAHNTKKEIDQLLNIIHKYIK